MAVRGGETMVMSKMRLTLSRDVIEALDKTDGGIHPGFRPAHAKGVLLTGVSTPSSDQADPLEIAA